MRLSSFSIGLVSIALVATPAVAGQKGQNPKSQAPKPQSNPKPVTATTTATAAAPKTHGAPKAPKTTTTSTAATGAKTHGNPHKAAAGTSTTTAAGTTATGTTVKTTATTTTPPEPLNPIAQKVSSNKGLSPKMNTLLPKNITLNEASKGFKNQGQFIAALHVSQNLGIPFADLKEAMTGIRPIPTKPPTGTTGGTTPAVTTTTGEPPRLLSLGQAIQKLRPRANADAEALAANKQATVDIGDK